MRTHECLNRTYNNKGGSIMTIDVYQIVTDRIIARMEKGEIPWKKP